VKKLEETKNFKRFLNEEKAKYNEIKIEEKKEEA
jgi:hypothetical protein